MVSDGPWAMITAIRMPDLPLVTLSQWLSPAYPVGAFAWSHGLEMVIREGTVSDAHSLTDWLRAVLHHGAGRNDGILLVSAARADRTTLAEIAELAEALGPSPERRAEACQMGAAFAATVRAVHGFDVPDMPYPVAVGCAVGAAGLPLDVAVQLYLQSFVINLVQAAQRLMPLGQTQAQACVNDLSPDCVNIAAEVLPLGLDDLGSCAFAVDIASLRHEDLEPRMFRS